MPCPARLLPAVLLLLAAPALAAQEPTPARVEVGVDTLRLEVGDTARVPIRVLDAGGAVVNVQPFLIARAPRGAVVATREGQVIARLPGTYDVRVAVPNAPTARADFTVVVRPSPVTTVTIGPDRERLHVGTATMLAPVATDRRGTERRGVEVTWRSSDPAVASVDRFGQLMANRPGRVTVSTEVEGVRGERTFTVVENPVRTVLVELSADAARTGDVIHASARVLDARGRPVADAPVSWSLVAEPVDSVIAASPAAEIDARGRFVAQKAGRYTIIGEAAGHTARALVMVKERDVAQDVRLVGHGAVRHVHSSDLWVWEGADGRDYAITGTWGGNGVAYFWDVSDPANQQLIDSVTVDARTVNDVKVSEDGRVCVISREGASDRKNGLVILDCSNPHDVSILSTFDDDMTGGVHNVFVHRNHVYAVNNGRKYDIINIEDPRAPRRVGVFELSTPGHAIHDVWVVDGIAYSSNWRDGVVLVDVGNGVAGGTPGNPVQFAQYAYPLGSNHAAFPYKSPSSGKTYLFLGDEIFPYGLNTEAGSTPTRAAGYIHVVDFTDPMHPEEVARYEVPEAGSHNLWVEDDKLYAAFYNGGVRVVDVSGELKGNLYYQNREVARYLAEDPKGFIANAPMAWGPQPHKGKVFFTDWNSGLWAIELAPREAPTP